MPLPGPPDTEVACYEDSSIYIYIYIYIYNTIWNGELYIVIYKNINDNNEYFALMFAILMRCIYI